MNDESRVRGAGGTPGGIGEFFLGLVMVVIGAYLITNRIVVVSSYWSYGGYSMFGLSLLPLIFGIGILFFNGKSIVGWILDHLRRGVDESSHLFSGDESLRHDRNDCALSRRDRVDNPSTCPSRTVRQSLGLTSNTFRNPDAGTRRPCNCLFRTTRT